MDREKWKWKFSKALENRMQELGLNAHQLSRRSGVDQAAVYRYLYGLTVPNAYIVVKLAEALCCSTDELISFASLSTSEDYYGE